MLCTHTKLGQSRILMYNSDVSEALFLITPRFPKVLLTTICATAIPLSKASCTSYHVLQYGQSWFSAAAITGNKNHR